MQLSDLFVGRSGVALSGHVGGSSIYEDSAQTTPATTSGSDPIGAITDLSGLANPAIQATSANRLVYYIDSNGIRSWRRGRIGGVGRWLVPTADLFTTAAMTVVSVYRYVTSDSNGSVLLSTFNGDWGAGGYLRVAQLPATPNDDLTALAHTNPASGNTTDAAELDSYPIIAQWVRSGTGSNQTTLSTYNLHTGALIGTVTGTQDALPANKLYIGYGDAAIESGIIEEAFLLVIDSALSADDLTWLRDTFLRNAARLLNWYKPTAVDAVFDDTGATGNFYDTGEAVTVDGSDQVTLVTGQRKVTPGETRLDLAPDTPPLPGPLLQANGAMRFIGNGTQDRVLDCVRGGAGSATGTLGGAFYIACKVKWDDGFARIVIVEELEPHDAQIDFRIGAASASNPSGVSGVVQDAQANIAAISGITPPAAGDWVLVTIKRAANGNATVKVGGQSGTITKGAATAGTAANTRFAETYAPTGHDWSLGGRIVHMVDAVPDATQEAAIEAYVDAWEP